jgi:hypothetical protein
MGVLPVHGEEIIMTRLVQTLSLALMLGVGASFVVAPASFAATKKMTAEEKKAKSKECSDKADQQNLHGKARKAFRSKCKRGES